MAFASAAGNYCLGCGCITKKKDRRVLYTDSSKEIIEVWRDVLQKKLEEEVNISSLVGDDTSTNPAVICRKCFNSFKRYKTLQEELLSNMQKAILHISLTHKRRLENDDNCSPIKRRKLQNYQSEMSYSVNTSSSPSVQVISRIILIIALYLH